MFAVRLANPKSITISDDSWFEDLCAKLEKKYDVDPLAFYSLEGGGDDAAGGGEAAEEEPVRRHNIAAVWVAFLSR